MDTKREDLIKALMEDKFLNYPMATAEEISEYRKMLEEKNELQLMNLFLLYIGK